MPGRVLVTGASGFVGTAVVNELLLRGHAVSALAHRRCPPSASTQVEWIEGSLFDRPALDRAIAGRSAVIHLVGIINERPARGITFERIHVDGTAAVVEAAVRNGVRRFIHMSALGARAGAASRYHQTKYRAEEIVRGSGLEWTIFRPSLIHGPAGEFMRMEAAWARRKAPPFLFMPYFGAGAFGRGGAGMLQPVFVGDVARAFVDALQDPRTIGELYLLGGPDRITWPQLHEISSRAIIGRRRAILALPVWKAKLLTRLAPAALLPFNRDQVIMSQEDSTCDLTKFQDHFGWAPRPFEQTLRSYAAQL